MRDTGVVTGWRGHSPYSRPTTAARARAVVGSGGGAAALIALTAADAVLVRPGTVPTYLIFAAATAIALACTLGFRMFGRWHFAVHGVLGLAVVTYSGFAATNGSPLQVAVNPVLSVVPTVAASRSTGPVTTVLTATAMASAAFLAAVGADTVALFLLQAGAAATTVLVPVLLMRSTRHDRDRVASALTTLADTDPLTSLPNRRGVVSLLGRSVDEPPTPGTPFIVAMVDIDDFKKVNDTFGHDGGDRTLIAVARAICQFQKSTALSQKTCAHSIELELRLAGQWSGKLRVAHHTQRSGTASQRFVAASTRTHCSVDAV